jgi:hypothetical protein
VSVGRARPGKIQENGRRSSKSREPQRGPTEEGGRGGQRRDGGGGGGVASPPPAAARITRHVQGGIVKDWLSASSDSDDHDDLNDKWKQGVGGKAEREGVGGGGRGGGGGGGGGDGGGGAEAPARYTSLASDRMRYVNAKHAAGEWVDSGRFGWHAGHVCVCVVCVCVFVCVWYICICYVSVCIWYPLLKSPLYSDLA